MMKTWVKYTLIGTISVTVIGGTTFGAQRWAYSKGVKEVKEGGPSDLEQGLSHLKLAHALRNRNAAYEIGLCYWDNKKGIENQSTAVEWFEKAVERGNTKAQAKLGVAYYNGQGVPQNYAEAMKWYQKAAEQGHDAAQCALGFAYNDGRDVPQNYAEAVKWFQKAANQGNADAQTMLGFAYGNGRGVPQNYAEAVKWFQKAADQGHAFAQFGLGRAYLDGLGVPISLTEAVKWLQKAADQGNDLARKSLPLAIASQNQQAPQDSSIKVESLSVVNDSGYPRIRGTVLNMNSRPMDAFIDMELVRADGVVVEQFSKTCYQVSPGGRQLIDIAIAPYYANARVRLRNLQWR